MLGNWDWDYSSKIDAFGLKRKRLKRKRGTGLAKQPPRSGFSSFQGRSQRKTEPDSRAIFLHILPQRKRSRNRAKIKGHAEIPQRPHPNSRNPNLEIDPRTPRVLEPSRDSAHCHLLPSPSHTQTHTTTGIREEEERNESKPRTARDSQRRLLKQGK